MTRPHFFIVGAPKAGTSSMASYLRQHPCLYLPDQKDVPFFGTDLDYRRKRPNSEEYLAKFEAVQSQQVPGDACASYLQSSRAANEIHTFEPNARIVVMLRDPVEAMYSMHSHLRYLRSEDIEDFEAALAAEADRALGKRIPSQSRLTGDLFYRSVFSYSDHLERFLDRFGSDQVLILLFDDLQIDPQRSVRKVYEFLEVDPDFVPDMTVMNASKSVRFQWFHTMAMRPPPHWLLRAFHRIAPKLLHGKIVPFFINFNTVSSQAAAIDPDLDRALRAEITPDVRRLSSLISRDLSGWIRADPDVGKEFWQNLAKTSAHGLG